VGFWYGLGEGARAQLQAHLRHYLDWLDPAEVSAALPASGFAGSPRELRQLLRRLEDLGADDVMLAATSSDVRQAELAAEALA
jgi:hypothetical protein